MKSGNLYFLGSLIICLVIGVSIIVPVSTHASTCVQISAYLSYGQTDSTSGGQIITLQDFLQSAGYLTARPNGHFGSATLSAVEAYQSSNGIPVTGYVGPLTLASINSKTCPAGTSINASSNPQTCPAGYVCTTNDQSASVSVASNQTVTNNAQASTGALSNMTISSPVTGQVLSIGSSTVIHWSNPVVGSYNISLEQPGGAGAGFIAQDQSPSTSGNQYVWKVGNVFSSLTNSTQSIAPGTYRIRLQSDVSGTASTDQVSGWFTVVAPQFVVSSVVPSSAYADNATPVVLFGSGFTPSSAVYFDTNYSSLRANNAYVSPDGSLLVIMIPTTVPTGPHTLFIDNGISSSPVTVPFVVSSIQ